MGDTSGDTLVFATLVADDALRSAPGLSSQPKTFFINFCERDRFDIVAATKIAILISVTQRTPQTKGMNMTTATKLTNDQIESLLAAIDSANFNAREAINNYEDSRAAFMYTEIANNDLKQAFLCARDDRRMMYLSRTPAEIVRDCNDLLAIHNLSPLSPSPAAAFAKFRASAE